MGQETATPILRKSNRIILHFKDTTGLFTQLARILIDRGHDIDFKDRELGILRTKPSTVPGGELFTYKMEVKTVFRDSTITFSGETHQNAFDRDYNYEVLYTKKGPWAEMMLIGELLKPASITYLTVNIIKPNDNGGYVKPPK